MHHRLHFRPNIMSNTDSGPPKPPIIVSKDAPPPPSTADVSAILDKVFNAPTSSASVDASYALCELFLSSVGAVGLVQYDVLSQIRKAAADKKSGARRESAQKYVQNPAQIFSFLFPSFSFYSPVCSSFVSLWST